MESSAIKKKSRAARVWKNLKQGMSLAYAASPPLLIRYSLLGIVNATMAPISVLLGSMLVNRIAEARQHSIGLDDMVPILVGLWIAAGAQRAIGAYMGYGRSLFVRRVELEAELSATPEKRVPKSTRKKTAKSASLSEAARRLSRERGSRTSRDIRANALR